MSFFDTAARAKAYLHEHGRVSLRALSREFALDGDALEELIEELVEIQQVATRDGKALAWIGATTASRTGAELPESPPERDPRAYTPKHLADKILQSKSALEGERKQVTVLFADVKGSMELAEQLDPEAVAPRSSSASSRSSPTASTASKAPSNQYTGDGIMALFGAPIAHEDHAQRACYAALHLRDTLKTYADALRVEHGLNFSVRMGHQLRRGRRRQDRRRPAHGLHGARATRSGWRSGWKRSPRPGKALLAETHDRHRPGLLRAARSRRDEDQGRRCAGARRRARGRRPHAHAAGSLAGARALEVRRPRRGDGTARDGAAPRPRRRRAGGRGDGRSRLRQVAAVLRVPRALSRPRHHRAQRHRRAARPRRPAAADPRILPRDLRQSRPTTPTCRRARRSPAPSRRSRPRSSARCRCSSTSCACPTRRSRPPTWRPTSACAR